VFADEPVGLEITVNGDDDLLEQIVVFAVICPTPFPASGGSRQT
jgi:hypothetical protein